MEISFLLNVIWCLEIYASFLFFYSQDQSSSKISLYEIQHSQTQFYRNNLDKEREKNVIQDVKFYCDCDSIPKISINLRKLVRFSECTYRSKYEQYKEFYYTILSDFFRMCCNLLVCNKRLFSVLREKTNYICF